MTESDTNDKRMINMITLPDPTLKPIQDDSYDVIVISTNFDPNEKYVQQIMDASRYETSKKR